MLEEFPRNPEMDTDDPDHVSDEAASLIEYVAAAQKWHHFKKEIDESNMTIGEARKRFGDRPVWDACVEEIVNMIKVRGAMEVIDASKLKKNKKNGKLFDNLLFSKDFLKAKYKDGAFDKLKCRIVIRGDLQEEGTFGETKSPTGDCYFPYVFCILFWEILYFSPYVLCTEVTVAPSVHYACVLQF